MQAAYANRETAMSKADIRRSAAGLLSTKSNEGRRGQLLLWPNVRRPYRDQFLQRADPRKWQTNETCHRRLLDNNCDRRLGHHHRQILRSPAPPLRARVDAFPIWL